MKFNLIKRNYKFSILAFRDYFVILTKLRFENQQKLFTEKVKNFHLYSVIFLVSEKKMSKLLNVFLTK